MELIICHSSINNCSFIVIKNGSCFDRNIAKDLGLLYDDYIQILKNNNGFIINNYNDEYCFYTTKDAESAIKELEPYVVMASLINE